MEKKALKKAIEMAKKIHYETTSEKKEKHRKVTANKIHEALESKKMEKDEHKEPRSAYELNKARYGGYK